MARPTNLQRWQIIATALTAVLPQALAKEVQPLLETKTQKRRRGLAKRSRAGRVAVEWLHGLHLYGAFGICAFGAAICALFGWDHSRWVTLWFLAALLVYNVDRVRSDPADKINVPRRLTANRGMRTVSWLLVFASAFFLVWLPIQQQDWISLGSIIIGGVVCLGYSVPIFGRRLKEVPLLKTFFAPTIVLLAIFGLPILHGLWPSNLGVLLLSILWAWGYLMCNMVLCDLRDMRGDRRTGVISLPVQLGRRTTHRLLWILIACTGGVAALLSAFPGSSARGVWLLLSIVGSIYVGGLAWAVKQRRSERFYEWWVEGMLFLPAVVVAMLR
ncbi:UbiA family prenyltransferase [Verrucomicrobiota bacterium sgz303538]